MNVKDCFKSGLLRRTQPTRKSAERSLALSLKYIRQAEQNLELGNYGLTIFCSYTVMFHAARGVLFLDGVKEHSHSCLGIYLAERSRQERGLAGLASILDGYRMSRHASLYSLDSEEGEADARKSIHDAVLFRERISAVLDLGR